MPYALGAASRAEMKGVHPRLVAVVERAIVLTEQDFTVFDGLRTPAEQAEMVRRGASQTLNSKHLRQADGFGHAMDLVPWINGKPRWEWGPIFHIAAAVAVAAAEQSTELVWGGAWDTHLSQLNATPDALEQAVAAYGARRRKQGRRVFIDGPHFQLAA